jgi:hypothetical protein
VTSSPRKTGIRITIASFNNIEEEEGRKPSETGTVERLTLLSGRNKKLQNAGIRQRNSRDSTRYGIEYSLGLAVGD